MSRFGKSDDKSAPTRIIRNDPTRKIGSDELKTDFHRPPGAQIPTEKIDAGMGAAAPTEKVAIEDELREVVGSPKGQGAQQEKESPAFMDIEKKASAPKTMLFRPKESASSANANVKPVVGWLVVISGPGRGNALEFSFGMQSIGRDDSEAISLNFGDEKISRQGHASIEYDNRERVCYLSKGSNLLYVNGSRVGQGSEYALQSGDSIEIGDTVLRYVPLCGKDFCWTDEE